MLQIGDAAPDFTLLNQDGRKVSLKNFRGFKLVLFAFPKAGTLGCTRQACAFRDSYHDFAQAGAVIVGISPQTPDELKNWRKQNNFPYELLADHKQEVLKAYGAWGMELFGMFTIPYAHRSYWVIDEDGIIQDMRINIKPVESVEESLATVQQLVTV